MKFQKMKNNRRSAFAKNFGRVLGALAVVVVGLHSPLSAQTSGNWAGDAAGNWSDATKWSTNPSIPGGATSTVGLTAGLGTNRVVTIDTTSRTVGILNIGDVNNTHTYTLNASGGGVLIFDNSGSGAQLNQVSTSRGDTVSAPISLLDHLMVSSATDTNTLTLSGSSITGSKNLTMNANGTGAITVTAASVNNAGTITNSGTGTGTVTFQTGVIGTNVTGVIQDSATSQLTLGGTNTFTSGVTIKKGTVLANSDAALGNGGTLLLGDTSGTANASLLINSFTIANNITVQAGSSGLLTISNNGTSAARPTGNILLNNDLTIRADGNRVNSNAGALLSASGTISGAGDLKLNVTGIVSTSNNTNSPQMANLSLTGPLTLTGSVNNTGTGNGWVSITSNINNASSLNQNSATSMLQLSGTNTYAGDTNVDAGVLRITTSTALSANSAAVNVASGGTLQIQATITNASQTLNLSGFGTSYSYGALESTNNAAYGGSVVLLDDAGISSDLATTTLTLSGTVSGADKNLTTSGAGNISITNAIGTGAGGITKLGTGVLTLGGSNTYTGLTRISGGFLSVNSANALGGGGDITLDGGAIRHNATNLVDYGSRIVNSTGPVSIDTNTQNVTYSDIDSTNTGGLAKLGSGRLTLSGTNSFSGPIAVNAGALTVSTTSAIPSAGTGQIFIDANGALNTGGAYGSLNGWLGSGDISASSTGVIAITGANADNINFAGYSNLGLGATTNGTYTGTITTTGGTYRLGGGGATLTLSGTNALTGTDSLVVSGGVTLTGANDMNGATSVNSGTLTLSGSAGGLASSALSVNSGSTLAVTSSTSATAVNRAASLNLNRGTLTVTGNNTANSTDTITGALNVGSAGNSILTLNVAASSTKNTLLTAGSLTRSAGGTALIRGASLGVNNIASPTANSTNLQVGTVTLVGGTGTNTTDEGILVGVVGDTSSSGTGFGATGGLLTSDATKGVRLVSAYKTSITDGQTQLDNVRLSSASGTATTTLANATTINSLSIDTSAAAGSNVQVTGAGTLTISSGVIHSRSVTATTASAISNTIDFNGREAVVLAGGSADLNLSGVLSNTGGNGLTVYGNKNVLMSGASANTYTGTTTVNGGTLTLGKTTTINSIPGNLTINAGGAVTMSQANQIADSSNVTVNGGTFTFRSETLGNLTVTNGGAANTEGSNSIALNVNGDLAVSNDASLRTGVAGPVTVTGTTTLSNGGNITLGRSQNTFGNYDSFADLQALNITNKATGAYTAITINHGSGLGQSGAKLILNGDVTFTGNATNTNTVMIDAIKGNGRQGQVALTGASPGNREFNVGNGAAVVDLTVTAPLVDGTGGASGLTKSGLGTLGLTGTSTYTGATTINGGTLLIGGSGSINGTSGVTVNTGGNFKYNSSTAYTGAITVAGGTVSGTGPINVDLALNNISDTVSPGNSPGIQNYGVTQNWSAFTYDWEVNDFTGLTAGTAFDQITITGSLALNNSNLYEINVLSLLPSDVAGNVANFSEIARSWTVLTTTTGITGFNASNWNVDASGFTNVETGVFTLTQSGNDLVLNYSAIPEPSTYAMIVGGLGLLVFLRRKNKA